MSDPISHQNYTWCVSVCVCVCFCMYVFPLLSFAWCDIEWGPRWSQGLGKQVHPHHQTPLTESTDDQSQNRNGNRQNINAKWAKILRNKRNTYIWYMIMLNACYLLEVRLQWAVKWSGLHMFRYQSQFPQDVKGQLLLNRTEVTFGHISVFWIKTHKQTHAHTGIWKSQSRYKWRS